MRRTFDVDIDVKSGTNKTRYGTRTYVYNDETKKIVPHPSGHFLPSEEWLGRNIPVDAVTGLSALDSDDGEESGYFKVDLLTNTAYDGFRSKKEVLDSMDFSNFDWDVFLDYEVVKTLPHLSKHFSIVRQLQPRSVEDLADILALIRPGKIDLYDAYLRNKDATRRRLYKKPSNGGMYFKLSHSIAYAVSILVTINKPKENLFGL